MHEETKKAKRSDTITKTRNQQKHKKQLSNGGWEKENNSTRVAKVIIIRIANVRHAQHACYEREDGAIYGWHATMKTGKFLV